MQVKLISVPANAGATVKKSEKYSVTANGRACDVFSCLVSKMPFNRSWPGKQRDRGQSEESAYLSLFCDGAVQLCVTPAAAFSDVALRPLSKRITPAVHDGSVSFTANPGGQYSLEFDDEHRALHIFVNPLCREGEERGATYIFGPGMHFPGVIRLGDNESVYIHPAAVVYGSITGENVKNVRVYGGGVLDGGYEERLYENCYEDFAKGCMRFYNSEQITVEDIICKDSSIWVISVYGCRDITVDNLKMVGHWRYNTDGIDIVNSRDVVIKNSFIRVFDDGVVLKGIDAFCGLEVSGIVVENCVLWCGWGRTLEIGLETACPHIHNIRFENCDLIHNSGVCLDVQNGDYAHIFDVAFHDIRIELQNTNRREQIQQSDDDVYVPTPATPRLIGISDYRFRQGGFYAHLFNQQAPEQDAAVPVIERVQFSDIAVDLEKGMEPPRIFVLKTAETSVFRDITVERLTINGRRCTDIKALLAGDDDLTGKIIRLR